MTICRETFPVSRPWPKLLWYFLLPASFQAFEFLCVFLPFLTIQQLKQFPTNSLVPNMPLALFLERLSILISSSNVQVDVNHIAGVSNDLADALSRWDQQGGPPCICNRDDRFPLSLGDIRSPHQTAQLYPSDAWVPRSLP